MPKPLHHAPPTSSVAAMLERGVGDAIITKIPFAVPSQHIGLGAAITTALSPAGPLDSGLPSVPRQFLLSPACDATLRTMQLTFAETTCLHLRQSELLRAILIALQELMPQIRHEAASLGCLRRPKNDRNSGDAQEALERRLADALLAAARSHHSRPSP